ncbi:hypothetical protein [Bacteroides sp.]|uniref:hypothetical protein n=1 Tax=Bacteroides sp. TaxID=29523 RepID=UPI0025901C8E|nr:hypothetical protein [Bacteroides sp.]
MTEETYNLLEGAAQFQLRKVTEIDPGTEEGREHLAKAIHLVELLINTDRDIADDYDKQERRKIEEERNKAMNEIERDKQKLTWGRVGLEMAKVVVPLVVSFAGYNVFQKRILKFEETGRLTTTASRELHLPKCFK